MTLFKWSQTAASNATADASINWQEGQAPSSVNDSARAMMSAVAKHRDDIAGAIVTAGTSTAYTVSSYEVFDTFAHLNGQIVAFTPHTTNGATVTLNVDSLGARPLRSAPSTELLAGILIQGTPYLALFNNSDGAFYLHGLYGNAYNVPLLGGMDYWDTVAPNSSFIFPAGQAISRTTYATAFARWGTSFGAGDGSTTFNVPDKTGRVSAMKESSQSRLTPSYFGGDSRVIGQYGGGESHTMSTAEMPSHNHTITDPGHVHAAGPSNLWVGSVNGATTGGSQSTPVITQAMNLISTGSNTTGISLAAIGGGVPHAIVQPTIVCNYIIRIV